ncbi:MAG: chemotaxis protein CheX [Treponema sp.]|jgi:chemotaxis protein CheX|nr:chemotaxis protein CheX [Treponema sp.]
MEKYIQPFIDVCQNVFKQFVGLDLVPGRPFFEEATTANEWDISSVIGLTGEARGAVVVSMKTPFALRLTEKLTDTKHTAIDSDVVDAIGEIVNIIAGNVKKNLEEAFRLVISLPTIIEGPGHQIKWPNAQARIICVPFDSAGGDTFCLSVAIESTKGA